MSDKATLADLFTEKHSPRPWRIDKDNTQGIELVADNGDLVFIEDFGGIPTERGASFAEQVIDNTRANFYLAMRSVNHFDEVVAALEPFAMAASLWESFDGQHDYLDSDSANNISVGDLRRARKALAAVKGQS